METKGKKIVYLTLCHNVLSLRECTCKNIQRARVHRLRLGGIVHGYERVFEWTQVQRTLVVSKIVIYSLQLLFIAEVSSLPSCSVLFCIYAELLKNSIYSLEVAIPYDDDTILCVYHRSYNHTACKELFAVPVR